MEDFQIVYVNDKVKLLMSAINKINTNFHYKFETLSQQLSSDLIPHIEKAEQH